MEKLPNLEFFPERALVKTDSIFRQCDSYKNGSTSSIRALRDRPILAQPWTPDQCGPVGPSPFLRDLSDIARPDPSTGGKRDPLDLSSELPPPDSSVVDSPDLLPVLPLDIILS
eukprot:Gb_14290 [translate_table: standard]